MAPELTLAQLRFDAGLTPEELGEEVGVAGRTIRRIEDGHRPGPAVAKKLADRFQIKPSDLWTIEKEAA